MLASARASVSAVRRAAVARSFAAAAEAAPAAAAPVDAEHKAWLESVKKNQVVVPRFEWTLEWVLPTPVPVHQFTQSPIVIEVKDRNPDPDALVYRGPNVLGGYVHPLTGKVVTKEEHEALVAASGPHQSYGHH